MSSASGAGAWASPTAPCSAICGTRSAILLGPAGGGRRRLDGFGRVRGRAPDYGEALKAHYAKPPSNDWQTSFVSNYAGAHPWEDFAETWAHYLHIVDTLETARAFASGSTRRWRRRGAGGRGRLRRLPGRRHRACGSKAWLPLAFAVNSLNRSMGHRDLYPFVLARLRGDPEAGCMPNSCCVNKPPELTRQSRGLPVATRVVG